MNKKRPIIFVSCILLVSILFFIGACEENVNSSENAEEDTKEIIIESEQETPSISESQNREMEIIWTFNPYESTLMDEEYIYTFGYFNGTAIVQSFDMTKGETLWEWEDDWENSGEIAGVDDKNLYLARDDGRIYSINKQSGGFNWKTIPSSNKNELIGQTYSDENRIYFSMIPEYGAIWDSSVFAIDKTTGDLVWELEESTLPLCWQRGWVLENILDQSSKTILLNENHHIKGVDFETGSINWFVDNFEVYTIKEGIAYGVGSLGRVGAIDIKNGDFLWLSEEYEIGDIEEISNKYIYGYLEDQKYNEYIKVIDINTGEVLCIMNLNYSYLIGEFDGLAVVSNCDLGFTWGIEAKTGKIIWKNDDLVLHKKIGNYGDMLIGVNDKGFIFGIDLKTGEKKWRQSIFIMPIYTGGKIYNTSGSSFGIVLNDKIFVKTDSNNLMVLNANNGEIITSIDTLHEITSLRIRDNILIVGKYGSNGGYSAIQLPQ